MTERFVLFNIPKAAQCPNICRFFRLNRSFLYIIILSHHPRQPHKHIERYERIIIYKNDLFNPIKRQISGCLWTYVNTCVSEIAFQFSYLVHYYKHLVRYRLLSLIGLIMLLMYDENVLRLNFSLESSRLLCVNYSVMFGDNKYLSVHSTNITWFSSGLNKNMVLSRKYIIISPRIKPSC